MGPQQEAQQHFEDENGKASLPLPPGEHTLFFCGGSSRCYFSVQPSSISQSPPTKPLGSPRSPRIKGQPLLGFQHTGWCLSQLLPFSPSPTRGNAPQLPQSHLPACPAPTCSPSLSRNESHCKPSRAQTVPAVFFSVSLCKG